MKDIKWRLNSLSEKQTKFELILLLMIVIAALLWGVFFMSVYWWGVALSGSVIVGFEWLFYRRSKFEQKFVEIIKEEANEIVEEHNKIVRCEEKSIEKNVIYERVVRLLEIIEDKYNVDSKINEVFKKESGDNESLIIIQQHSNAHTTEWNKHKILEKISEIHNKLRFIEWANCLNKDVVCIVK